MYQFSLSSHCTSQGSPTKKNEDGFFVTPTRFVMIDGATGRAKNNRRFIKGTQSSSDAAWLVSQIIQHYPSFPIVEKNLRDNIRAFGTFLNKTFLEQADLPADLEKSEVPCAAASFAILDPSNETIQIAGLADTETIVIFVDGSFEVLAADPRIAENEKLIIAQIEKYKQQHNCDLAEALQATMPFSRERATVTNMANNRGVLNVWDVQNAPDESFANYKIYSAKDIASIIMYTDGIDDSYDLFTHQNLIDLSKRDGFQQLIDQIRDVENSDPLGMIYPRTKTSDDATIACVIVQKLAAK